MRPVPQAARGDVATTAITVLAVIVTSATAAVSGTMAGTNSKMAVILPLTALVGAVLCVLALTRFKVFVMCMLVMRASMDLAKLSAAPEGAATASSTANQQVAARGLDPSSILAVVFIGAAVVWLAAQYRGRGRLPGSPLRRAFVVFFAAGALSIIGAADPAVVALEGMRILAVVLMFVVLEQMMTNERDMRQLLVAVFLSLVFPLAFTAFGFFTGHPRSEEKGGFVRITGPFLQSNTFGRYLMLMIIFGVAIVPYVDKRWRRPLVGLLGLSFVFMLLTYTRTAIVGTVLGLLVVGFIQSKRLLFSVIVIVICALAVVPELSSRFTSLSNSSSFYGPANNSLTWRLGYWTEVLPLANSNPVTGIGLGMTSRQTDEAKQPHNDFIRAYVETGLIGLGAYVALLISLVTLGRRAVRASPRRSFERAVGAGFLGCALAFIADSVSANVISNVVTLWYVFAFAAAASAVVRQRRLREDRAVPLAR